MIRALAISFLLISWFISASFFSLFATCYTLSSLLLTFNSYRCMSSFCMIYTSLVTHFLSILLACHNWVPYNLPPMNILLFDLAQKCIECRLGLTLMTLFLHPVNRHDGYMGGRQGGVGVFSILRYMFTCSLVTDYLFNCYPHRLHSLAKTPVLVISRD